MFVPLVLRYQALKCPSLLSQRALTACGYRVLSHHRYHPLGFTVKVTTNAVAGRSSSFPLTEKLSLSPPQLVASTMAFSSNASDKPPSVDDVIEQLSDLALTAKDELEFAEEARNTVYYNEEKLNAQKAIENMNSSYSGLLTKLSTDAERAEVNKRIGMKIKEIQTSWELMTALDLE